MPEIASKVPAAAPLSYRQVIRLPGMPALLAAMCLSRLAERVVTLALVLFVLQRFEAPALAGWAAFLALAPGLVVSPLAGALIDRLGAARAVAVDMAASALLLLGMPLAAGRIGALFVLVGLYSLTKPLGAAGVRTLLPALVPATAFDRANALDTAGFAATDALGPAVCGLLFAIVGGTATLVAAALLYGVAALCLAGIMPRTRAPVAVPHPALLREAIDGVLYVARDATLRTMALSYSLYMATWGMLVVVVPVAVTRVLGAGGAADMTVGGLWALCGAAAGLGALGAGRIKSEHREKWLVAAGMLATAVVLAPLALRSGIAGLAIAMALTGLLAGPVDVGLLSLRQRRTDPARLGRVLAVSMSLNLSGLPFGSALGGLLVALAPGAAFAAAAGASALAALAAALLIPGAHNTNGISRAVRRR